MALASPVATAGPARERKLEQQVHTLRQKLTDTRADLAATDQIARALKTQNDQLRAGLPQAILAVPLEDFGRLVFTPARQAWRCDSFYQGTGGYWSLSFDSMC